MTMDEMVRKAEQNGFHVQLKTAPGRAWYRFDGPRIGASWEFRPAYEPVGDLVIERNESPPFRLTAPNATPSDVIRFLNVQEILPDVDEHPRTPFCEFSRAFSNLIIAHGPRSPIVHTFMDEHRNDGLFLRYALRLTQLQEYAAEPELLRNRRNHMDDTEADLREQLAERMRLYGPKGDA